MLPKMGDEGAVCAQYVRCGKAHCRCARGDKHGPYYYRFWRDGRGRLRKSYVRRGDAPAALVEQAERRAERRARRTRRRERGRSFSLLDAVLRNVEKLRVGPKL